MIKVLLIALGGGIGATTRYLVSDWAAQRYGGAFPYGTLLVNVVGCLIIGLFMQLVTERIIINPYWRLLVTVGFLGGLTTFSSLSYETIKLVSDGDMALAMSNILANTVLCLLATWIGITIAKAV
ncbi:putative fluoride ion transporter CrcB [bioreactor metagenome]|uniref:Putative fluoride ion transporter CrcB n=1 Tax=bioreactor metagenome TaxID=1076179 RepID=A0A644SYK7_9ZZZZ|nr:fluoride efflux transporter CrcB [Negativicutes bacterium]